MVLFLLVRSRKSFIGGTAMTDLDLCFISATEATEAIVAFKARKLSPVLDWKTRWPAL